MPDRSEIVEVLQRTESYLTDTLLPFWIQRSPDREAGGFLSYFDRHGKPTGQTIKTFLMQARLLYTMSAAHRAGYGGGQCLELARRGADFLLENYWDLQHGGWFWIADRQGRPTFLGKIGYGQCFGIYAFSEYGLSTGDARGLEAAGRTLTSVRQCMADKANGGYFEIMKRDWTPEASGKRGGDRKSLDVHMHMMEALTSLYELSGLEQHRDYLQDVIHLILKRMLHPEHGTGYMQFATDFTPLPAIRFEVEWGSDEEPEGGAIPLDVTSYGHNVEFAWLLLRAADVLGEPRSKYAQVVGRIFDQCIAFGIDPEYGGVYIEGPIAGKPANTRKQFWQQAEVMVGMLDGYALLKDEKYWLAFRNVHDFVMNKFVNLEGGGEWFALLDREGKPIWDYLGHQWKISYHTVRSMIEVVRRLKGLAETKGINPNAI